MLIKLPGCLACPYEWALRRLDLFWKARRKRILSEGGALKGQHHRSSIRTQGGAQWKTAAASIFVIRCPAFSPWLSHKMASSKVSVHQLWKKNTGQRGPVPFHPSRLLASCVNEVEQLPRFPQNWTSQSHATNTRDYKFQCIWHSPS